MKLSPTKLAVLVIKEFIEMMCRDTNVVLLEECHCFTLLLYFHSALIVDFHSPTRMTCSKIPLDEFTFRN